MMARWIYLIPFLAFTPIAITYALDDNASSFVDIIPIVATVLAFLFGALTFFKWRKRYLLRRNNWSLFLAALAVVAMNAFIVCSLLTYRKINKPYNLSATLPGDHKYEYYFRTDSTLKIIGHFVLVDGQSFQQYHMKGDTICLDTIITCTGIVSLKYIFETSTSSKQRLLVPIDEKGMKMNGDYLYIDETNR